MSAAPTECSDFVFRSNVPIPVPPPLIPIASARVSVLRHFYTCINFDRLVYLLPRPSIMAFLPLASALVAVFVACLAYYMCELVMNRKRSNLHLLAYPVR